MRPTRLGRMKRWLCVLALASAMPTLDASPAAANADGGFQRSLSAARDAVLPHVVSILVVREDFSQSEAKLSLGGGSGTIIDANGYVLTNAHVTENGRRFRVVLNDGREFRASLRGDDPISDLAVLKIETDADERFGAARFAGAIKLQPGDTVLAMGAPWGMRDSVSAGVVNNPQRLMVSLFEDEADYEQSLGTDQATARYYAWIQHDASINPGNSGGPLVDLNGQIVGINTRGNVFGGDMAFSIPAPVAESVARALITHGHVRRSDFGFSVRSIRGTSYTDGALVNSVDRASLAEKAGLRAGDRIVRIDGRAVTLREPEDVPDFRRELSELAVGTRIELELRRGSDTLTLGFASVSQDELKSPETEIPSLGISASNLTRSMARARYLDSQRGAIIAGVRPGGPAATAQPPLQVGDLMLKLDGTPIADVSALVSALNKAPAQWLPVTLDRKGETLLALIKPAEKFVVPEQQHELSKAWAGWEVQPITAPMAKPLKLAGAGFRITRIFPNGPAANAGMRVGDLIQKVGDVPVMPSGQRATTALDVLVRNASIDEDFEVAAVRDGRPSVFKLRLVEQPLAIEKAPRRWISALNMRVRDLTLFDRVERNLDDSVRGAVIDQVENGGYGGLAHLKERDLIVRVDGESVADVTELTERLEAARKRGHRKLSFLVMRGVNTRLLFVDAPWSEKR